jgi:predicted site-specific integrase-resolvase
MRTRAKDARLEVDFSIVKEGGRLEVVAIRDGVFKVDTEANPRERARERVTQLYARVAHSSSRTRFFCEC